jgi:hypothetical protein
MQLNFLFVLRIQFIHFFCSFSYVPPQYKYRIHASSSPANKIDSWRARWRCSPDQTPIRKCRDEFMKVYSFASLNSGNACYHSVQNLLSSRLLSKNIKITIYKTIILHGCENWSLSLSKNRVLRIFGPKRDEVTGGWGKLHNEELHNLYSSPSTIRMTN